MKSVYFDPFSGISGDMCLGALADAGCPMDEVREALMGMEMPGFDLTWEKVMRGPIEGTKVTVTAQEEPRSHRTLADVLDIVDRAAPPAPARGRIETVFSALARAEGRVHGKPHDKIHFHEVGCFDAIADIAGTILGLHLMGVEKVYCSRIQVGEGFVGGTRHGTLPLPAPATAYLLENFEVFSHGRAAELVTPTGAALMAGLAGGSSPMPPMRLKSTGYGAGTRDFKDPPNLLRVFVGEERHYATHGSVTVVETHIDDMNPEHYDAMMDHLFAAGVLDVTLASVMMKKNRPATRVTVIAPPHLREEAARILLNETSAIGVRMHDCERRVLQRKAVTAETPWGTVQGKICWGHGIEQRFTPEYEDCRRIHESQGVPLWRVYLEACNAFHRQTA